MSKRQELDTKLTPAAKQALDELVADYRDQLLLGAADSASRLGELREISVHDIMAGLNRQQDRVFGRTGTRIERILRLYVVGGFLLGVIGLVAFTAREILIGRGFQEQLFLVAALGGLLLSAMSYFLLWSRKSRGTASLLRSKLSEFGPGDYGSYLVLWRDIELALRRAAAVRLGESAANAPLSGLLDILGREQVLSSDDQLRLRRLLNLRNSIAHGRPGTEDEDEIANAARDAERLLSRIRSLS